MAVSPFLSTALTSLPSSKRHLYGFQDFGVRCRRLRRENACRSGRDHQRRGVSALGINGSAPSLASRRISSASPVRAASRNGVAPVVFRLVRPTLVRIVILAFRFAPLADELSHEFEAGHVARSLSGAGSLLPSPGLRTQVIVCSAVQPAPAALGSAPASSSIAASSK